MSSELPFKLPVRKRADRIWFDIIDSDGATLISERLSEPVADAIVAALNGYAAMREALESMPRPLRMGGMSDFGIRILVWQAKVDAALTAAAEVKP